MDDPDSETPEETSAKTPKDTVAETDERQSGLTNEKSDKKNATTDQTGTVTEAPVLKVQQLIDLEQLQKTLPDEQLETVPLEGIAPSPKYNALRLTTARSKFGLGIQVWREKNLDKASARFERMKRQSLNAETLGLPDQLPSKSSFRASRGGIKQTVIQLADKPYVAAISCGSGMCPETTQLDKIIADTVRQIHDNAE
jgi:hypothetical protein